MYWGGEFISDVEKFLSRFHSSESIDDVFTSGCCFWFAYILASRFRGRSTIMYDDVENHFGTKIDEKIYDITGDVTSNYTWERWSDSKDSLNISRIIRDCIMF